VLLPKNTGSCQESTGKNQCSFRPEYCFHVSAISGVYLKDTATFLHLSYRIMRDPVAGIFVLGLDQHIEVKLIYIYVNRHFVSPSASKYLSYK
jgi:hypothetical protein